MKRSWAFRAQSVENVGWWEGEGREKGSRAAWALWQGEGLTGPGVGVSLKCVSTLGEKKSKKRKKKGGGKSCRERRKKWERLQKLNEQTSLKNQIRRHFLPNKIHPLYKHTHTHTHAQIDAYILGMINRDDMNGRLLLSCDAHSCFKCCRVNWVTLFWGKTLESQDQINPKLNRHDASAEIHENNSPTQPITLSTDRFIALHFVPQSTMMLLVLVVFLA